MTFIVRVELACGCLSGVAVYDPAALIFSSLKGDSQGFSLNWVCVYGTGN
jgi:hypothetical protein